MQKLTICKNITFQRRINNAVSLVVISISCSFYFLLSDDFICFRSYKKKIKSLNVFMIFFNKNSIYYLIQTPVRYFGFIIENQFQRKHVFTIVCLLTSRYFKPLRVIKYTWNANLHAKIRTVLNIHSKFHTILFFIGRNDKRPNGQEILLDLSQDDNKLFSEILCY